MDIEQLSAAELGREINKGNVTPTETVKYFENRITQHNPKINAFVYTKFEEAEKAAKVVEEKLAKGDSLLPFAGVPFALKDFLPSKKGWTHSHGGVKCLIKQDPYSSVFCEAMERAGGIAIGKTNSPAFGFRGTCDNKLYGPTCNPFNTQYNSGGSSGGSAAAVAAGLVPIAEGGDAGGSIRIPAAWCNCYGFKASVGTIPSVCRPDAWSATHPFCFNGGLTKTVEDAAILLDYMAHFDSRDPFSVERRPEFANGIHKSMCRSIKGWKIAFIPDFNTFSVDPEVAGITYKAVSRLREAGATVHVVPFNLRSSVTELAEIWCQSLSVDTTIEFELAKKNGFDLIGDHREDLPEEFIYYYYKALNSNIFDLYKFNLARTEILDAQNKVFENYDIIVSPTTACLPVLNAEDRNTLGPDLMHETPAERLIGFAETFIFNFTGNPAASVPAGFSKSGLPIGMQIVGKKFRDIDVLTVSKVFEDIQPWRSNYNLIKLR